jgi:hypothetical protein
MRRAKAIGSRWRPFYRVSADGLSPAALIAGDEKDPLRVLL